jgi:hypothetical protein
VRHSEEVTRTAVLRGGGDIFKDACRAPGGSADVLCSPNRGATAFARWASTGAIVMRWHRSESSQHASRATGALTRLHKALHIIWGNDLYSDEYSDEGEPRDAAACSCSSHRLEKAEPEAEALLRGKKEFWNEVRLHPW